MAIEKIFLPDEEQGEKKMPVHTFTSILSEYLNGQVTAAPAKTAIEAKIERVLSADETTDILNMLAYLDGGADVAEKQARLRELDSVLILAQSGAFYGTRELLKARLNLT